MNGNEKLQLLPGTKKRLGIKIPGENRFLYIGSAILGAAIVIALWFNFNNQAMQSQIKSVDEQLFALEQKRNKKAEDSINTTRQQILLATQLIDNHTYLTKAFSRIENMTREDVQIKDIAYNLSTDKMAVTMRATGYSVIARQLASLLSDDNITDVLLGKMTPDPGGTIEFSFEIAYNRTKLLKKNKIE